MHNNKSWELSKKKKMQNQVKQNAEGLRVENNDR